MRPILTIFLFLMICALGAACTALLIQLQVGDVPEYYTWFTYSAGFLLAAALVPIIAYVAENV